MSAGSVSWPSSSATVASVGSNGAPIPASSDLAGAKDPSGNLQPLLVDNSGNLKVSVQSNPIQDTNLAQVGGAAITEGQKTMANSLPVVVASDQSAIPVSAASLPLPTGASTSALQSSVQSAPGTPQTVAITVQGNATGVALPVSASALPLPTGAATAANQTNASQKTQLVDGSGNVISSTTNALDVNIKSATTLATTSNLLQVGSSNITLAQKTMAASLPVVIASDQSAIPVSGTIAVTGVATAANQTNASQKTQIVDGSTNVIGSIANALQTVVPDQSATGNITTQNLNPNSGAATAGSTVAITALNGQISWTAQITGTYTGALTPQVTVDGANWIALSATAITNINTNAQAATVTSAAVGIFEISAPPCAQLRITALGAMTGTAVVTLRSSAATGRVGLDSPIPAGTAIIGALSANQSTNVAQVNGVAPLMGNGVTGTGSLRVTIASDTTSNTNPYLVAQAGRTSANTPTFNTNSGANITTSAYLQLVASTTSACKAVEVYNQTSSSIYFATGAAASEVNQFIIPPGGNGLVSITIAASTRISVKAVDATASTGSLIVNYWT